MLLTAAYSLRTIGFYRIMLNLQQKLKISDADVVP